MVDGRSADELFAAAQAYSDAGDEASAEPLFAQAATMGDLAARYNQGNALSRLGRVEEAAAAFREVMEAGDTDAPLNLGLALQELGELAEAEAAFRQAIAVGDPRGVACLGDLLWEQDQAAAESLLRAAADDGDRYAVAELVFQLGEAVASEEDLEGWLRCAADVDKDAAVDLARLIRRKGRLEEAESLLRVEVAKGNTDAMIALALLLEEDRGQLAEAEAVLRAATEMIELHAWNNLGLILEQQRRYVEAVRAFEQGAQGGDPVARRNLKRARASYRRQINRHCRTQKRRAQG